LILDRHAFGRPARVPNEDRMSLVRGGEHPRLTGLDQCGRARQCAGLA